MSYYCYKTCYIKKAQVPKLEALELEGITFTDLARTAIDQAYDKLVTSRYDAIASQVK